MIWNWDPTSGINLILSLVILAVGCWDYVKTKRRTPFFIGVAFGLFSVSHLITLLGVEKSFGVTVILVRIFGYLIIISAMIKMPQER